MHVFPQLRKLERKYPNEVVVIGVHSPKFPAERETPALRAAVMRFGIEHPVVNDRDFRIWHEFAGRAWPTLYFIDPEGKIIGRHEGEIRFEDLDGIVSQMIAEFNQKHLLTHQPLAVRLERSLELPSPLLFPGNVLVDPGHDRLFIADSGHNRLIVTDLTGEIQTYIGSGGPCLQDGDFDSAGFNNPQGLALADSILYVADTDNHALRKIDLDRQTVATIAGNGEQAHRFHGGGWANQVELNSPWALALRDQTLYVALAGFHQIWQMDLAKNTIAPFAGSGQEGLQDGPLDAAMLAQPNGLALDGDRLYFVDSETSSVRFIDLRLGGRVETIVGEGLFEFGDIDGVGSEVRLQHPLGIAAGNGMLYIADSYNNKIKRIDPVLRATSTYLGNGQPGNADGFGPVARFREPSNLSRVGNMLVIADTNNNRIRIADLLSHAVHTLGVTEESRRT